MSEKGAAAEEEPPEEVIVVKPRGSAVSSSSTAAAVEEATSAKAKDVGKAHANLKAKETLLREELQKRESSSPDSSSDLPIVDQTSTAAAEEEPPEEVVVVRRPGETASQADTVAIPRTEITPSPQSKPPPTTTDAALPSALDSLGSARTAPRLSCAPQGPSTTGSTLLLGVVIGLVLGMFIERRRRRASPPSSKAVSASSAAASAASSADCATATSAAAAAASKPSLQDWLQGAGGRISGLVRRVRGGSEAAGKPGAEAPPATPRSMNDMKRAAAQAAEGEVEAARATDVEAAAAGAGGGVRLSAADWAALEATTCKKPSCGGTRGSAGGRRQRRGGGTGACTSSSLVDDVLHALPTPPKLAPPPKDDGGGAAGGDAFGALWSETKPARLPLVDQSKAMKTPPSLTQLAQEKKRAQASAALQSGLQALGSIADAASENSVAAQQTMDELFREREARRLSVEVAERKAEEEANAAAAALTARYRIERSARPPVAARDPSEESLEEEEEQEEDGR